MNQFFSSHLGTFYILLISTTIHHRKENEVKTIQEVSDYIAGQLKNKMIVHRYDAYSTDSVYLKFDYGIACSLRISDHTGKKHLAYRYNIGLDVQEPYEIQRDGLTRKFYPPKMADKVIEEILCESRLRRAKYRNYEQLVRKASEEAKKAPGFWRQAKEVQ